MKNILILSILATLLGGCAIVPATYRDGRDGYFRDHDRYYRDRDYAHRNDNYWNRDGRYRDGRRDREYPYHDQGS